MLYGWHTFPTSALPMLMILIRIGLFFWVFLSMSILSVIRRTALLFLLYQPHISSSFFDKMPYPFTFSLDLDLLVFALTKLTSYILQNQLVASFAGPVTCAKCTYKCMSWLKNNEEQHIIVFLIIGSCRGTHIKPAVNEILKVDWPKILKTSAKKSISSSALTTDKQASAIYLKSCLLTQHYYLRVMNTI